MTDGELKQIKERYIKAQDILNQMERIAAIRSAIAQHGVEVRVKGCESLDLNEWFTHDELSRVTVFAQAVLAQAYDKQEEKYHKL